MLDEKYKVVLLGLSREQIGRLPKDIIGLPRTRNQRELAEIYSAADLFVNPSREETMGLVTAEALACGTPAVVSNCTAVPYVIDQKSGSIVNCYSSQAFAHSIRESINCFEKENCISRAKYFDMWDRFEDYVELYHSMMRTG